MDTSNPFHFLQGASSFPGGKESTVFALSTRKSKCLTAEILRYHQIFSCRLNAPQVGNSLCYKFIIDLF